jgi:alanyl-tRNA synthetase
VIRYGKELGIKNFTESVILPIFEIYDDYEILKKNKKKIIEELKKEEKGFLETLEQGIIIFEKLTKNKKHLDGKDAFLLYQSYGFPFELTLELANEKNIRIDEEGYEKEFQKHQELSRTATQGKFKSGLADNSDAIKKLHTATHLLNTALRKVLKNLNIYQKGSNITPERLRFDFNFDRKLTEKEIKEVEDLVNQKIKEKIPIICEHMSPKQAKEKGAQGVFDEKYLDKVSVYSAGDFSKEICAGPHVSNTNELGVFKIIKEESSAAGVRRIKAILEN